MRGKNSLQSEEQIRFWSPNQGGRGGFLLAKAPAGSVAEQGGEAMSRVMEAQGGRGLPRILSPQITALVLWALFFPGLEHTEFN